MDLDFHHGIVDEYGLPIWLDLPFEVPLELFELMSPSRMVTILLGSDLGLTLCFLPLRYGRQSEQRALYADTCGSKRGNGTMGSKPLRRVSRTGIYKH